MGEPRLPSACNSWYGREADLQAAALAYVYEHPGCTTREVADAVYGRGHARSTERNKAARVLRDFEGGWLRRDRSERPHRWHLADEIADPDVLADMLGLVMASPPAPAEISGRSIAERIGAELWAASAAHAAASDAGIRRFPQPDWLGVADG